MMATSDMTVKIIKWAENKYLVMCSNGNGYCATSECFSDVDGARNLALSTWGRIDGERV